MLKGVGRFDSLLKQAFGKIGGELVIETLTETISLQIAMHKMLCVSLLV